MPADRFYTPDPLTLGALIRLPPKEETHMLRVMRKQSGDLVELFNGTGGLYEAEVTKEGHLKVTTLLKEDSPPPEIIIAQALITPNKLDWVVEKCAELGASSFWLFPADKSEKKMVSDTLLQRLQALALSAAKQSGRLYLMEIVVKPGLKSWPSLDKVYFGSLAATAAHLNLVFKFPGLKRNDFTSADLQNFPEDNSESSIAEGKSCKDAREIVSIQGLKLKNQVLSNKSLPKPFIFAIGPEKGFSEAELKLFSPSKGLSLSPYTLRTETAALVLLSQLQYL